MRSSLLLSIVGLVVGLAGLVSFWAGFRSGRDPLLGIRYDEMAGMIPFFGMVVSGVIAGISVIALVWMLFFPRA